jgi:aminopeptidase N
MPIKRSNACFVAFLFCLCSVFLAAGQDGADKSLRLKLGDPRFKEKVLDVVPEGLYAMETGTDIAFAKMIKEMKGVPFVYIGETHNSLPMHDLQFKIIQALYEQDRNIAIGLEMFPVTSQEVLNKWSLGILSEEEFIREGLWYINWNFNFGFYKKIFDFAKANRIPMFGLNAPRELITKIRMSGWDALKDEEKAIVPKPDLTHPEHRQLIRTIFESADIPHQMKGASLDMMFEGLYRSQTAWDFVMGFNALEALKKERKQMIVLAGSGHLIYNLGINLRAREKSRLSGKTVISVFVPEGQKGVRISRSLGDYIWGIPEEEKPAYPSVGLSFKKFKGLENLVIDSKPIDGAAKAADFEKGDVVLAVDGKPYTDINELRAYLAQFKWEEEVKFRILRSGQDKDVSLKFKEQPPVPAEAEKERISRWPQ